jgi:hypothetical protein
MAASNIMNSFLPSGNKLMNTHKTWLRTIGLHALHCGLFAVGAMTMLLLFVSAWLGRILSPLPPAIFSALPEHYRRVFSLLVGAPPQARNSIKQESAD